MKRVLVNGVEARMARDNFAEWEAVVPAADAVVAHAEDSAGNIEKLVHEVKRR